MQNTEEQTLERSWLEENVDRFANANAVHLEATKALLADIIDNGAVHARFVNTLSMLEHLGSHKIMATQHSHEIEQATLRHVAEEAHHAYFMKRQAEKIAGLRLSYVPEHLLAGAAARMYFMRLEAGILHGLANERSSFATYLYMSMIVEFRALWFYGLYEQALKRAGKAMSLKRILGEEAHHLNEMAERLDAAGALADARVDSYLAMEQRLYARMLDALRASVNAYSIQ